MRRIGLHYPRDLINFDFDAYFTRWFRLYDLDLERLGRYHQNKLSGGKRKRARIEHYGRTHGTTVIVASVAPCTT